MLRSDDAPMRVRWARLRFQIIGQLLASPPEPGELSARIAELAERSYRHPGTGESIRFGASTIERWYYLASHNPKDPLGALYRRVRANIGMQPSVSAALLEALHTQYRKHPRWSYKLHYDNLCALAKTEPGIGLLPSYTTLSRVMKSRGWVRRRPRRTAQGHTGLARETRSFEVRHVHGLWHLDFHVGRRRVLTPAGDWVTPVLFGCLDDNSRLCGHLQWYHTESAETLCHGLSQAILKRGLPRALLTDNGAAMLAAEVVEGLSRLGIVHHTTLPYHAEQNGKQEHFWARVEGRLMAMLEGKSELTLALLNEATLAWLELDYHRSVHSELRTTPLQAWRSGASVGREAPDAATLRRAFRTQQPRKQRLSDGTVTVEGVRFEIPAAYRTLLRPTVRFARWDLSSIDLVDPRTQQPLCVLLPLDKHKNADGRRRILPEQQQPSEPSTQPPEGEVAPLLQQLMAEYAATGLPPAYVPHHPQPKDDEA